MGLTEYAIAFLVGVAVQWVIIYSAVRAALSVHAEQQAKAEEAKAAHRRTKPVEDLWDKVSK